jgi:hypothetical protein
MVGGCGEGDRPAAVDEIRNHPDGGAAGTSTWIDTAGTAGTAGTTDVGGAAGTTNVGGAGGGGTAGTTDAGGAAGNAGSTGGSEIAPPLVTILSPKEVTDPNEGDIITKGSFTARCQVSPGLNAEEVPIFESSIFIEVLVGGETLVSQPASATDESEVYKADIVLTDVPAGPVTLRCSAADTSALPLIGEDRIDTFVDKGPVVTVTSPKMAAAYSLRTPLAFEFTVEPDPLTDSDAGAEINDVTVTIDGRPIEDIKGPDADGVYAFEVDLEDSTVFNPIPSGEVAVQVAATNDRGVEASQDFHIVVDGKPPTINATPLNQVVGGKVTLEFVVTDTDTGVDTSKVLVTVNSEQFYYDAAQTERWSYNAEKNTFHFVFDTANLEGSAVQASITIDADDKAGNSTTQPPQLRGASLLVYLDNYPPLVSLDPPNIREMKRDGTGWLCSNSFDPLGPKAASDEEIVDATPHFRALVWDMTNQSGEDDVLYLAGTDPLSVRLFLQYELTTPLLIDTNDDGVCDEVKSEVNGDPLRYQQLVALGPTGSSSYMSKENDPVGEPNPPPAVANLDCEYGTSDTPPDHLCAQKASDMTRVIQHTCTGTESVVYAVAPRSGELECTGQFWELTPVVKRDTPEGWVCLAARASDKVGNVGISPPLRVCYDDPGTDTTPDCAVSSTTPPTCTDGCEPPSTEGLPRVVTIH